MTMNTRKQGMGIVYNVTNIIYNYVSIVGNKWKTKGYLVPNESKILKTRGVRLVCSVPNFSQNHCAYNGRWGGRGYNRSEKHAISPCHQPS